MDDEDEDEANPCMLSCKGRNVWKQRDFRHSSAAVGMDRKGRVLFLHCRSPYSVHDLVEHLQALPLHLTRAFYVEGGPEAQLYVHSGAHEHEFIGSYETSFHESDTNASAWPVPNVVGVVRRSRER